MHETIKHPAIDKSNHYNNNNYNYFTNTKIKMFLKAFVKFQEICCI